MAAEAAACAATAAASAAAAGLLAPLPLPPPAPPSPLKLTYDGASLGFSLHTAASYARAAASSESNSSR